MSIRNRFAVSDKVILLKQKARFFYCNLKLKIYIAKITGCYCFSHIAQVGYIYADNANINKVI